MKIIKIFLPILSLLLILSCSGIKESLSMKKKANTDEFLIEKKNPLVLPPDYSELPMPRKEKNKIKKEKESIDLSKILSETETDKNIITKDNLEKSILKKIEKK